jgi:hypothetical protein
MVMMMDGRDRERERENDDGNITQTHTQGRERLLTVKRRQFRLRQNSEREE